MFAVHMAALKPKEMCKACGYCILGFTCMSRIFVLVLIAWFVKR